MKASRLSLERKNARSPQRTATRSSPQSSSMTTFDPSTIDLNIISKALASRAEREAERQRLRELTIQSARQAPLTGGWYWVPLPAGDSVAWQVQAFYDCWRSPSDHVRIWRHVRDSLEHHWRRRLPRIECYGLPRGRVSRRIVSGTDSGTIVIYHGRDAPRGSGGLAAIRRAFNLPPSTAALFDEHEQCIAGQPDALELALGRKLGVRTLETSALDSL